MGIRVLNEPFNSEVAVVSAISDILPSLEIQHPSLERIDEFVEVDAEHFLLGEMPKGSLLTERVKHFAPFSVPVGLATAIGICEGLVALHSQGVIHGDVGSHNVVATHDGGAKLQLAGMWRAYSLSKTAGLAVLPQMAYYLAPELTGGGTPSVGSDIYALGVVLFLLLTGRYPFEGPTPTATVTRHANGPIPSARGLNPSVPSAVDQFITRLLAKNPANRPQSANECLTEMRKLSDTLRFGRSATSSQKNASAPPEPTAGSETPRTATMSPRKAAKNGGVAPNMSAIRDKKSQKQPKPERDVPIWLWAIFGVFFSTMVFAVSYWVFSSFQKPKMVNVPTLTGLSFNEAQDAGRKLKIAVRISGREPSDKVEIDKIVSESPGVGGKIREGGTIYVVLSTGSKNVVLPKLVGMTTDEAKSVLAKLNLDIDGEPVNEPTSEFPPGIIVRQYPEANQKVERVTPIRVWVAIADPNPKPVRRKVPKPPASETNTNEPGTGPGAGEEQNIEL